MQIRRSLLISLTLTAAASLWAALHNPSRVVAASTDHTVTESLLSSTQDHTSADLSSQTLPLHWDAPPLQAAQRNPFTSLALAPLPSAALPTAALPPLPPKEAIAKLPPLPPSAPPPSYHVTGRMVGPDGHVSYYLSQDNKTVITATTGTVLEDGYSVEAITDHDIQLVYLPLQKHVSLPLPHPNSGSNSS